MFPKYRIKSVLRNGTIKYIIQKRELFIFYFDMKERAYNEDFVTTYWLEFEEPPVKLLSRLLTYG